MKASLYNLILYLIGRLQPHIISFRYMGSISKADGKSTFRLNICGGLVSLAQAENNFVSIVQTAPCSIHGIRGTVLIIAADNQHRQGIKPGFCSKIFTHNEIPPI